MAVFKFYETILTVLRLVIFSQHLAIIDPHKLCESAAGKKLASFTLTGVFFWLQVFNNSPE